MFVVFIGFAMARNNELIVAIVALVIALVALGMSIANHIKLKKMQHWGLGGVMKYMGEAWGRIPHQHRERIKRGVQRMAKQKAAELETGEPSVAWIGREAKQMIPN